MAAAAGAAAAEVLVVVVDVGAYRDFVQAGRRGAGQSTDTNRGE